MVLSTGDPVAPLAPPAVKQVATQTALASSALTVVNGQTVVLTARVTGPAGSKTPTGTVDFFAGKTRLGTADVSDKGVATLAVSTLAVGKNTLTATYNGDASDLPSTSASITETVVMDDTTTTLSVVKVEDDFTTKLHVVVAPPSGQAGAPTPGGTVDFYSGKTMLGTAKLEDNGQLDFEVKLPAGANSLTAVYGGDRANNPSTSAAVSLWVGPKPDTTTSLNVSPPTSWYGHNVNLDATVSQAKGNGKPTGTVDFYAGGVKIGSAAVNNGGHANLTVTTLPVGVSTITARYGGDDGDAPSGSSGVNATVRGLLSTSVRLVAGAPSSVYGRSVTFDASVANGDPGVTPGGTVDFYSGSTLLGSAAVDARGHATFSTARLPVGRDTITASYRGDDVNLSSSSDPFTQTVDAAPTATTLSASSTSVVYGAPLTLTAAVATLGVAGAPTGRVDFYAGEAKLGSATLDASGHAAVTASSLPFGTLSLTAVYRGDATDAGSVSPAVNVSVNAVATTTVVTPSSSSVGFGAAVTVSAAVTSPAGTGTPTGWVDFFNGPNKVGSAQLDGSGRASLVLPDLGVGNAPITASYSGDTTHQSSTSAAAGVTVAPGVRLRTSESASQFGQGVTFDVDVGEPAGGRTPSGKVKFTAGSAALGEATLDGRGHATFTVKGLKPGRYDVTASYGGDTTFKPLASPAQSTSVTAAATSLTLTTSEAAPVAGQAVTLSAVVSSSAAGATSSPNGTIVFKDGDTVIGTVPADVNGYAAIVTAFGKPGSHAIQALFQPADGNYLGSTAAAVTESVSPAAASQFRVTLPDQAVAGTPVQGTVTALDAYGNVATGYFGTVHFESSDAAATLPADLTFTADGKGTASFSLTFATAGSQAVTMADAAAGLSTARAFLVGSGPARGAATTTSLELSSPTSVSSRAVTLTATVKEVGAARVPTGPVDFFAGTRKIGYGTLDPSGKATLVTKVLPLGSTDITAVYRGNDADRPSASAPVNETVTPGNAAPTRTVLQLSTPRSGATQAVTMTASVTATDGSALPAGAVDFYLGNYKLGFGVLDATGRATFTTANLPIGADAITAYYRGNKYDQPSASAAATETVAANATTTSLTAASDTGAYGGQVTLKAAVTAPAGTNTPTGSVDFFANGKRVGTGTLDASGVATFTTTSLPVGTTSLTARYRGNRYDLASGSAAVSQSVTAASTSVALGTSADAAVAGGVFTLTATVTPQSRGPEAPRGYVVFSDGPKVIGKVALDVNGNAGLKTSLTKAGAHAITAVFVPAGSNYLGSTSAAVTETVNAAAASQFRLTIVSTVNQGKVYGAKVTALDAYGNVATGYTGTVHFASTDTGATLPADVAFAPSDAGVLKFTVKFATTGNHVLSVSDPSNPLLGTAVTVAVAPAGTDGAPLA